MVLTAYYIGATGRAQRYPLVSKTSLHTRNLKTNSLRFPSVKANFRQPKNEFPPKHRQSIARYTLGGFVALTRTMSRATLQMFGNPSRVSSRTRSAVNELVNDAEFNDDLRIPSSGDDSGSFTGRRATQNTEIDNMLAEPMAKSKSHAYDNTFISCSPEVDVSCSRLDSKKTITPGSSRNGKERDSSVEHFEKLADQGNAKAALGLLYTTIHGSASWKDMDFRETSLIHHNLTLRACKRHRPPYHIEARRVLLQMRECGPSPNLQTYHEVIAALARAHEWRIAERTFAELKLDFPNHNPTIELHTSLISAYGKGGQWERAKSTFDALAEENVIMDTGIYNALLSAAVGAARYHEASIVFEQMPKKGIVRNVTTYNAILTSLGRQRRVLDMELVHKNMRKSYVEPNETTFSLLITAHGNAGDCYRAFEHLEEACKARWLKKSAVIFNSALGACVKSGESKLARDVLSMMHAEGVIPTLVTYNTMLMSASARHDWNQVVNIYLELLQHGLTPDAITFDCICGIDKLQSATDAPGRALSSATVSVPNAKTPFIRHNDYKSSETQNVDDKKSQLSVGNSIVTDLGTLPELLRSTLNELDMLATESVSPEKSTSSTCHVYDALLRALHLSGQAAEVETVFEAMVSKRVCRTVHTYNSLIASYEVRRQWKQAGQAMISMQEEGIAPDALTFDALINVCEEMGQWDRATAWLEHAQEQGHLRCEDELGVLDLHRIRSAGTAQTVLRWWLRRMRSRALAPLDVRAAGQGTRIILESATRGATVSRKSKNVRTCSASLSEADIPLQIRDLPDQIQVVTGWGKHSTVFGYSPVKERVLALLGGLNSPFIVPEYNIGCVVAERGEVRAWLVRDELLSLVRFLGGNRAALRRNFNPMGVDTQTS